MVWFYQNTKKNVLLINRQMIFLNSYGRQLVLPEGQVHNKISWHIGVITCTICFSIGKYFEIFLISNELFWPD
jgi:hypothetical protein